MLRHNIILFFVCLLAALSPFRTFAHDQKVIAITQIVEHQSADSVRQGIIDELKEQGFIHGKTARIHFENAQGSPATAAQIARKFAGLSPDVVLPITTPSAQTISKVFHGQTPVIFSAVTDPVEAGLIDDMKHPDKNVTGVTDLPPIKEQFSMIKEVLPNLKSLGVLYTPGDTGSAMSTQIMVAEAKATGIKLVPSPATRSADVKGAVLNLVGKVDAIYVPLDNTFVSAMRTVSQLALQHNLPVFSADSGSVSDGAVLCIGYSYYDHGRKAGAMAAQLLKGKEVKNLPVSKPDKLHIYINKDVAEQLDLIIPKSIASKAQVL